MLDYSARTSRNRGFVTQGEQERLRDCTVAVAGAGGDGGQVAVLLARMGVQRFRLADPEEFEVENLNRQAGCYADTLGRNKAEAVGELIARINPQASIETFKDGVHAGNISTFLEGADVVLDETEYTVPTIGVMIARESRSRGVPVATGLNIGFGCLVTTFDPAGLTFEEYLGLSKDASIDELVSEQVPLSKWVPRLPVYVHERTLRAVEVGEISAPSVAPGVALAAGVLATEVFNVLTDRQSPIVAPRSIWVDAMERRVKLVRWRSASFNVSAARLVWRSRRGHNRVD